MNVKGNHDVIMKKKILGNCSDIVLYHYHIANYRRYEDKAKRWSRSAKELTKVENYLTNIGKLLKENKLRDFYNLYYNDDMKKLLLDKGIIQKDYSVYNFMKYKGII